MRAFSQTNKQNMLLRLLGLLALVWADAVTSQKCKHGSRFDALKQDCECMHPTPFCFVPTSASSTNIEISCANEFGLERPSYRFVLCEDRCATVN